MNKCIECKHFDVRSFPEHTKQGQATCNPLADFFPIEHEIECKDYAPAPEAAIIKRRIWRDSK